MPFVLRTDRTRAGPAAGSTGRRFPVPGAGQRAALRGLRGDRERGPPNPALADLDGDGRQEILFPCYDGKLHAYWLDKTEHGSWPYDVPGAGIRFASEPVVADLDGDGHAEVIFTSWPQKSVGGTGPAPRPRPPGQSSPRVDLPAPFGGATWNGALGAPTLDDVDGDADLEVVVGTVSCGVVAYDLPGTGNARVLWGTGTRQPRGERARPRVRQVVRFLRASTPSRRAGCSTRASRRGPSADLRSPPGRAGCCRSMAAVDPAGSQDPLGEPDGRGRRGCRHLVLWAGDGDLPGTSSLSFGAGRARANNAMIELARNGTRTLWVKSTATMPVDVILDVNGYFE